MEKALAKLAIQEAVRKSRRLPLPKLLLVLEFRSTANSISLELSKTFLGHKRDVIAFFGTLVVVIAKFWGLTIENNKDEEDLIKTRSKEHLLWAFFCLKIRLS